MSKTSKYWKIREQENRQRKRTLEFIDSYNKQIEEIYKHTLDSVQKEIDAFYSKYANEEGISMAEAKKRVDKLDIDAYARKARRYVKDKTFTSKANAEMKIYNLTMKVNRLELLKSNIGLELVNGFDELEKLFGEKITEEGFREFRRQAGILGKTVVDTDENERYRKLADRIARASFHNATFSDRIWMHQNLLRNEIDKSLQQALISGASMARLARNIRKAFGTSTYNAERLMRTEIRRMQTDVAMESYKRNGNEKYEYMALGQHPCDICSDINGKIYNVKDMEIGANAPPMHPNCMCSTAPYVDEAEYNAWLAWLEKGGTTAGWGTAQDEGGVLLDSIRDEESNIKNSDIETVNVFDNAGNLIYTNTGGRDTVRIDIDDWSKLEGSIISHNHPSGGTLSVQDIVILMKSKAKQVRAVTESGTYYMGVPNRWSDEIAKPKELEARWDECLSNVTALAKIKANAGDFKTKDEYVKYCADKANALFALKYGLDYGYEKE